MGDLAEVGVNLMLDHVFKTTVFTFVSGQAYIALGSAATDTSFAEVADTNAYARTQIVAADWTAASGRQLLNGNVITFPTASGGAWGTSPGFWAIFTSGTHGAGNMLAFGSITTPTPISDGDTPSFAVNEIDISFNAHSGNVGIGTAHANDFLDHMFGKAALTVPTNIYVGFGDTNMTEADDMVTNELAAVGSYARVEESNWDAAASSATENTDNITFLVSGADWTASAITVFITDISAAGGNVNLLYFGKVPLFSAADGDTVQINIGDLDVTIT